MMRRLTSARRRRRCGRAPSQPRLRAPTGACGLTSARRAAMPQKKPKDDEAEDGGAAEPAAAAADDDDDDAALDFSKKKKKKPARARPARALPRVTSPARTAVGVPWRGGTASCADAPPCRLTPAEGAVGRGGGACGRGRARRLQR